MAKEPLISIICAIRNDERFIRETLQTVVSQSYPNWELIIMDGASTDKTLEIVKEYAAKYNNIILRSEPDEGQWHALDKALVLAKGEYLTLLCGQDGYLDKDWFKRCVDVLQERPEISLVWGIPFNMSEDGKLMGPHYAYAGFLKDERFGSQTKPLSTIAAKIDWRRPASFRRLWNLFGKLTPSRLLVVLSSFWKQELPQKESWFFYWLKTGRAFPESNMIMRKEVYLQNTTRFPKETMTNAALLDFCFNFNANGYLSYGLPIAASFGRSHTGGQPLLKYEVMVINKNRQQIENFKDRVKKQKTFKFIDASGGIVSESPINI